jgi:hypothetical protein
MPFDGLASLLLQYFEHHGLLPGQKRDDPGPSRRRRVDAADERAGGLRNPLPRPPARSLCSSSEPRRKGGVPGVVGGHDDEASHVKSEGSAWTFGNVVDRVDDDVQVSDSVTLQSTRIRLGLLFAFAVVAGYSVTKWLHTLDGITP